MFFSNRAVDQTLLSGYRKLRDLLHQIHGSSTAQEILKNAVFTAVEGETPNVTDSGNLFCRKLRQLASIPEARFVEPRFALERFKLGGPVIFVDDFIGSGDQIISSWNRKYGDIYPTSFSEAATPSSPVALYLANTATEYGMTRIAKAKLKLQVVVSHELGTEYSIQNTTFNGAVPDISDLPRQIEDLLRKYAHVLRNMPPHFRTEAQRMYGHHELGLLLAFEHTAPDATVPLIWADGPSNWTPLVRRT
jgi:hypothetical protein